MVGKNRVVETPCKIQMNIDRAEKERFKYLCEINGLTVSQAIRFFIRNCLEDNDLKIEFTSNRFTSKALLERYKDLDEPFFK